MNLLNKLVFLLLLTGFYSPSFAVVGGVEQAACSVFGNAEEGEKKEQEEEEPDCE